MAIEYDLRSKKADSTGKSPESICWKCASTTKKLEWEHLWQGLVNNNKVEIHNKIALQYHEAACFYESAALSRQAATSFLQQGEKGLAELQKSIGIAQNNLGNTHWHIAGQEAANRPDLANRYREAIPFYEESIRWQQEALSSFQQGKKELAASQEALALEQFNLGNARYHAAEL